MIGEKPVRYRSPAHLAFVRNHRCTSCRRPPKSDAHHLTHAQPKAKGLKAGDQYTVPLCRSCHDALHRHGDEGGWWMNFEIDPIQLAEELWAMSPGKCEELPQRVRRRMPHRGAAPTGE